jgi:soluble lytic murein transglycosylase-like protein
MFPRLYMMQQLKQFAPRWRSHSSFRRRHYTIMAALACAALASPMLWMGGPVISRAAIIAPTSDAALSGNDQLLYETMFRAQDRGDYAWADQLAQQLDSPVLMGTLLAQRYLSNDYTASADELAQWLQTYSDQPEAATIRALAERKGAPHDRLAELAQIRPLRGDGYTDHLGRRSAPDAFYQGLSAWKQGRFAEAKQRFLNAAESSKTADWHRASAYFWAARAAEKTQDRATTREALQQAAQFPTTFYGQLANAKLGNHGALMAAVPTVPSALRALPAVQRAQALAQINQRELAEDELRQLIVTLDDAQRPAILTLAGEMGLANLQLRLATMKSLSDEERLFARYPMPHWLVGAQQMVDPSLLLSMARQESSFRDAVRSPVGAQGLMQMLPSTARHIERGMSAETIALASNEDGVPLAQQLDDPTVSARLGAEYVALLARQPMVRGELVHLIAAYNAGPGTVAGWQKLARNIDDPLLYIESIPYPETRNYVMQVLAHQWVYATLMGQEPTGRDALLRGQWPMLAANG